MERATQKHILVLITNPFAVINVIHSGLMSELGKYYSISVMSDLLTKTDIERFNAHFHLDMHLLQMPVNPISGLTKLLRTAQMLFFGHFFHLETIRIKVLERARIVHWLFCISRKNHALTLLSGWLTLCIRNWLIRHTILPGFYDSVAGYDFQAVISTSPLDLRENAVVNSLNAHGIPCTSAIISWDNLTSKGVINAKSDMILVWNAAMALEYRRFYSIFGDNAVVRITGIPRFDIYFQNTPKQNLILNNKSQIRTRTILFSTGAVKHHACQNYIIRDLLEYAEARPEIMILVRCHPGDDVKRYTCFSGIKNIRFFEPFDASGIPPADFLEILHLQLASCEVCLQVASTMLLDAAASDKPCISIAYDARSDVDYASSVKRLYDYSHQLLLPNGLKQHIVCNRGELFEKLDKILTDGDAQNGLRDVESVIHHCAPESVRSTTQHIREWLG